MTHQDLQDLFGDAEREGKLHLVKSRRVFRPDMLGLMKIVKDNKRICFIRLVKQPDNGPMDEKYYECDDDFLSRLGREIMERELLKIK